ncbi:MAG: hypothetical protein KDC00_13335 [Flavobacteriales bacterium]|nr:hypothetical protein [Flavobacteriales bacterium]
MRIELGDNATDAIRFLLLGLGVLLFLRLAYAGLELWFAPPVTTDLAVAIDGFRNGYLLADRSVLVVGGSALMERMAMAAVAAAACATLVALPAALIGRLSGGSAGRYAIVAGRAVLFVSFAWWCFAALAVPPISVQVKSDAFVRTEHQALFNDLSIPFSSSESRLPRRAGGSIQQRSSTSAWGGCGTVEEVFAQYGSEQMVIARVVPGGSDCGSMGAHARGRMAVLTKLLLQEDKP